MPLPVFEIACVAVVVLTLAAMARTRAPRELVLDYAALAAAAFAGEDSCVALYRFYAYADGWHARLHHVPLLVPLIWPLVILSARGVTGSLWPAVGRLRPLLVGAVVAFDASLVEVVAVRSGLWSWAEPGHLGVPLIGILGWGYFAAGADWALSRGWRLRRAALLVVAPAVAHALILASWWGLFRWTLRGDFGAWSSVGMALVGAAALASVVVARARGHAIAPSVAGPRMIAAALFFALLLTTAPESAPLWAHVASVAVPYLAATSLRERRSTTAALRERRSTAAPL